MKNETIISGKGDPIVIEVKVEYKSRYKTPNGNPCNLEKKDHEELDSVVDDLLKMFAEQIPKETPIGELKLTIERTC
jgi:hypothetical protein